MAFNLQEFSANINKRGIAKNNLFAVSITLPRALLAEITSVEDNLDITKDLTFYCKSVTLPELALTTADISHQGFGAIARRPQGLTFPTMPAQFMVDSDFAVMKLFHRWMQAIINYDTSGGRFSGVADQLPYEMGYKKDYATTMKVAVYSFNSDSVEYLYEFSGLYPVQVGSINPAWENNGEVLTLPVGFTYDEMSVTGSKTGIVLDDRDGSAYGGILSWFSTINSVAQTIKGIRKPRGVQDAINQINKVNTLLDKF